MNRHNYHRNKIAIGLLSSVLLMPVVSVAEPPPISLELNDVDIHALVEIISDITGKNFIVDPRVEGEVSVVTGRELNNKELYDAFLTALQINGYTVVERGSITKIMPSELAKQETYPVVDDASGKAAEELVTRLVHTKHVPALSVVAALGPISRNVRIQHHADSNTIILSGRAKDIERFITIIKRLDSTDEKQIEVIPLLHANVNKMVKTIQGLNKQGVIGKITNVAKVSADERTNSILVAGDASSRMRIRQLVKQLDVARAHEGNTKVIRLRHATAENLAKVLEGSSTPRSGTNSPVTNNTNRSRTIRASKTAINPVISTATTPRKATSLSIKADRETNSLIITAEPDVLKGLLEVVRELDVPREQVLIETIVAEVSSQLSHSLGVQLGFSGAGNSKTGVVAATSYQSAGNNSLSSVVNIANGGVGTLASGLLLGVGGTSGGNQFAALLDTLVTDAATKILSTSTISTLNNDEAVILSGQNIPILTGSFSGVGSNNTPSNPFQTIERQDIGLTLKVKPQVNEGSQVKLFIEQEVSSLAASTAGATDLITNKRSIKTNVVVEDGEILVLGGLVESSYRGTEEKVPILGDIPILGRLFRHDSSNKDKQNMMVFIRPVILQNNKMAKSTTHRKYAQMSKLQHKQMVPWETLSKEENTTLPTLEDVFLEEFE